MKMNKTKIATGIGVLALIIATAIAVKQPPYMTFPLTISIFIMLLQTEINRYAFLIGGINAVIYATTYFIIGIYALAWYSLLFSFPLQIIAFINWDRHKYKNSTILKSLSLKAWIIIGIAFAICWTIIFAILYAKGNPYAILDSTSSLLGILTTIFSMLAYKEYTNISLVGGVISIFLNAQICINDIHQLPYLMFSVYSMVCIIISSININKIYEEQRSKRL